MRQLQQAYAISILLRKDVESRQKVKPQTHPPIQTGARDRGRSTQRGSGRGSQRGVDRGGHRGNPRGQGRGGFTDLLKLSITIALRLPCLPYPKSVTRFVVKSVRPSTATVFVSNWVNYATWCRKKGLDPLSLDGPQLPEYYVFMFEEVGLKYTT